MEFFQLIGNAASKLLKRSAKIRGQSGQDGYTQLVEGVDTEVFLEKSWQLPDIVKLDAPIDNLLANTSFTKGQYLKRKDNIVPGLDVLNVTS